MHRHPAPTDKIAVLLGAIDRKVTIRFLLDPGVLQRMPETETETETETDRDRDTVFMNYDKASRPKPTSAIEINPDDPI
jgi:hypothetical protein